MLTPLRVESMAPGGIEMMRPRIRVVGVVVGRQFGSETVEDPQGGIQVAQFRPVIQFVRIDIGTQTLAGRQVDPKQIDVAAAIGTVSDESLLLLLHTDRQTDVARRA